MLSSTHIFSLLILLIVALVVIVLRSITSKKITTAESKITLDELTDVLNQVNGIKKTFTFLLFLIPIIFIAHYYTVKFHWEAHVMEWLNLMVRWTHVVFGIAWIGASFYFIFLENSLNRTENLRDELAGNLWAIHGGGFYYVEKFKSAPNAIPKHLHWFKYEAYFTWLSGFVLLMLVYFMNAKAMMIDSSVSNINENEAIAIGLGTLLFGWIIYDAMCKTALLQKKKLFGVIGYLIIVLIAFVLCKLLNGRAAFMLVGALIGTIMAGNVFFCIIPSQKALVAAAKANKPVNPELGKIAGLRSLHNNYMTLPVIFIMISNHFPTTFGSNFNWAVLAGLTIASVAVRHYINLYEKGQKAVWMLPFAAIAMLALIIVTAPAPKKTAKDLPPVSISEVMPIIQKRCVNCHSANPTDDVNTVAPNGIMFDTPADVKKHADRILVRAVQTKTMPQGNKTNITEKEREQIGIWIEQGAIIN
jgi:uncharacterized membrane protein